MAPTRGGKVTFVPARNLRTRIVSSIMVVLLLAGCVVEDPDAQVSPRVNDSQEGGDEAAPAPAAPGAPPTKGPIAAPPPAPPVADPLCDGGLQETLREGDDDAFVGYAASPTATLLRWHANATTFAGATFVIRRAPGPAGALAEVARIDDPNEARAVLGEALAEELIARYSLADTAALLDMLHRDALAAAGLASAHPAVARILAVGYLDGDTAPGTAYHYRIDARLTGGSERHLGDVDLTAGVATPIAVPASLSALDIGENGGLRAPVDSTWDVEQADRRYHLGAYLCWPTGLAGNSTAWVTGYDVYRAGSADGRFVRVNEHVVQPQAADGGPTYADTLDAAGTYYYRVAPRDALGTPKVWPADASFFTPTARVDVYDLLPPPAPADLVATARFGRVTLQWTDEPAPDLSAYAIDRGASPLGPWTRVASVASTSWTDMDVVLGTVYHYRVQAIDESGNHGAFAGPVSAVAHDETPPAPPELKGGPHVAQGLGGSFVVDGDDDTTRVRVACRFGEEGPLLNMGDVEPGDTFSVENAYTPAFAGVGTCEFRAVDAEGNIGAPTVATLPLVGIPAKAPLPVITSAVPVAGQVAATIEWSAFAAPTLGGFDVRRTDLASGTVVATTLGAADRSFTDATVAEGATYSYVVESFVSGGARAASEARLFKMVSDGERALADIVWRSVDQVAGVGNELVWECTDPCGDDIARPSFRVAVFRSLDAAGNFTQLTPVSNVVGEERMNYTDRTARSDAYWYVVVQFDARTGEPTHSSPPRRAAPSFAPSLALQPTLVKAAPPFVATPCSATNVSLAQPLRFGGGFSVRVKAWTSTSASNLAGSGDLEIRVASGFVPGTGLPVMATVTRAVSFSGITVGDASNHVCSGNLVADLAVDPVAPLANMPYELRKLTLRPHFGTNTSAVGDVKVLLPAVSPVSSVGIRGSTLMLRNATVVDPLNYWFNQTLAQTCAAPTLHFEQETLPVRIVPLLRLNASPTSVAFGSACMTYVERNSWPPRPAGGKLDEADANDGFLRVQYNSTDRVTVTSIGVNGFFNSTAGPRTLASYPHGFWVRADNGTLLLGASRIASGALSDGAVSARYHTAPNGTANLTVDGTFAALAIGPGGSVWGNVTLGSNVTWLAGGLKLPKTGWELYLGPVTTPNLPAEAMWAGRLNDERDVGLAQRAALEPGLDLRKASTTLTWTNCAGPAIALTSAVDVYVRRGGVSDRVRASLASPLGTTIHGYSATLSHFELSMLDGAVYDSAVDGALALPFPTNVTMDVDSFALDERACVTTGVVRAGEKVLDYWDLNLTIDAVAFRPKSPAVGTWDRMLWTIGGIEIAHLAPYSAEEVTAAVGFEGEFTPSGHVSGSRLLQDRYDYRLDGLPFLLTRVDLSAYDEKPLWSPDAVLVGNPQIDPAETGFVILTGTIVAPYFGPLWGVHAPASQMGRPQIIVASGLDHVGFSHRLHASRQWVDVYAVDTRYGYDLVYAQHYETGRGLLVGFQRHDFVPDPVGIAAPSIKVLHLDTAAVIDPDTTTIHVGLSAGVAALRAISEARGDSHRTPLLAEKMTVAWGPNLGMVNVIQYAALTFKAWDNFTGKTYRDTTSVLDKMAKDLPDSTYYGGGTAGKLADWGVNLSRMRGEAVFTPVEGGDWQLEELTLSTAANLKLNGSTKSAFATDRVTLSIDRHGEYSLVAKKVKSTLLAEVGKNVSVDVLLRIRTDAPSLEGGLVVYKYNFSGLAIDRAGVAVGIGEDLYYMGATFDAKPAFAGGGLTVGGTFVLGRIDPRSSTLKGAFPDVTSHLADTGTKGDTLVGFYMRAYGEYPLIDEGCVLRASIGAQLATWYWAAEAEDTYGGAIKGWASGKAGCLFSGRGEIELAFGATEGVQSFTGEAWLAEGFGNCTPTSWRGWEHRWWDDSWCWCAGVLFGLAWTEGPGWTYTYHVAVE